MKRLVLVLVLACLVTGCSGEAPAQIEKDEEVVFFPACADRSDTGGAHWNVEVRGWIFEPETDSLKRKALLAVLRKALDLEEGEESTALFEKRARGFLVDSKEHKAISLVHDGGAWTLPKSGELGHFGGTVRLDGDASPGWRKFAAVTKKGDERKFEAETLLLAAEGVSVISDIDDTIKVSQTTDKRALLRNTFLKEYEPVAGMAELYRALAEEGAAFHYVTASPWQLYPALREFIDATKFPLGSFHMRDFALGHSEFFGLFQSPEKWKPAQIEAILERFPKRRFLLIGDSGEKDPEIYGALAREFPRQIAGIFIRNVTGETADSERLAKAFSDVPKEKWTVFTDPAEVRPKAVQLLR